MPLLQTITGKENNKDGIMNVYAFVTHADSKPDSKPDEFISKAARGSNEKIKQSGNPVWQPAVNNVRQEICGCWCRQVYNIEDGCLIKIYAKRKASWNSLMNQACIIIRMREKAAYNSITIPFLNMNNSTTVSGEFKGRFDVLTLDELNNFYGYEIPDQSKRFYTNHDQEQLFPVTEISPEIEAKEKIKVDKVNVGNKDRVVKTKQKRRKINLED